MSWKLAQLNIARMLYEPDGPEMQDFNDALESVNAIAEASPGFVWRLVSGEVTPEEELIFDDPAYLVNLSVWNSLEELLAFVRSGPHLAIMRRRREWFESGEAATLVLWWIPEGHTPSVLEAQARLERLRGSGAWRPFST